VHPDAEVAAALESAAAQQLIDPTGAGYRFHHSLTREAVVESLMPHLRSRRASALFTAATRGGPPTDDRLAMAIDLAVGAGRDEEAADLLIVAGHRLVRQGALGSAIDILGRAVRLTSRRETRQLALGRRIEVLAEAGRVDEALADGERLMAEPNTPAQELVRAHLALARAAAQASRWTSLAERLAVVDPLVDVDGPSRERQQVRVLAAELALARRDLEGAVDLADTVLAQVDGDADVRCAALSVRGRAHRSQDLEAAHHDFEEVLAVAEATGLSTWRLRALHELGTIDLFDHAGTARLRQAQALAAEVGASGLTIVLDVQLAAAHLFAFDLAGVEEHAMVAAVSAKRLHLHQLQATALAFLAESAGLRGALDEMETCAVRARSAVPGDREIEGSILGGRGVALLLLDRRDAAREALNQAASLLDPLPNAGPGLYRGLLPLLLTVERDPAAPAAARAARAAGVTVNRGNEGLLKLAEAVELARQPDRRTDPVTLVEEAMRSLAAFPGWAQLGLVLTAEAALADAWGDPAGWIDRALLELTTSGMTALAERCQVLAATGPLKGRPGVTPREQEVWTLLAEGLTNKQIASRLTLSPRTIEKHVENLLRKTGTRTRTELARAPGLDLRTPRDT
jgi:DNA-binding CsgD family transcriptional regulator/tetratricopeptide (TPR) repeat protein